jgi:hypothetical protein
MDEGDARVRLLSAPGEDADLVTGIRHQAGMLSYDTLHTPDHGRRGVMEEGDPGH